MNKKLGFLNLGVLKLGAVLLGVLIFSSCTYYYMQHKTIVLYADGQRLALVAGKSQANKALVIAGDELSVDLGVVVRGTSSELLWRGKSHSTVQPLKEEELVPLLKERLAWVTDTWVIEIEGEPVLCLASEAEAQEVLDSVLAYYFPSDNLELKIEKSEFKEDIKIVAGQGLIEHLQTKDEALNLLIQGQEEKTEHIVKKGESLWTIARDHDLRVADLEEMNPSLKGTYLRPGDILNLKKVEPLLTVNATATVTMVEKIPYKVVYEKDPSLWCGQQQVKETGKNGTREVICRLKMSNDLEMGRQVLAEKILQEAKPQVVSKGAKVLVASRSSGGNSVLSWPLRGKITCPYGTKRGNTIHTGVDIDGITGDPVHSAGDGKVLFAGWKGTYGNCVDIDHGQGLTTRYAHLNTIDVTVGQKVSVQSVIGKVGSTGRSTGSHLHFEVRVNGQYTNPLRYLN